MSRWSRALIALIIASTAAFAVGVAIERHQRTTEAGARAGSAHSESAPQRAAETGGEGTATEASHGGETSTAAGSRGGHTDSSETLLGINPESTGLVAIAVVLSLLLALAVWKAAGILYVLGAVSLAMGGFVALDIREVIHQANESRAGLTLLAAGVAALHLAAALLAGRAAPRWRSVDPALRSHDRAMPPSAVLARRRGLRSRWHALASIEPTRRKRQP